MPHRHIPAPSTDACWRLTRATAPVQVGAAFRKLDVDGSGDLSWDEFVEGALSWAVAQKVRRDPRRVGEGDSGNTCVVDCSATATVVCLDLRTPLRSWHARQYTLRDISLVMGYHLATTHPARPDLQVAEAATLPAPVPVGSLQV